MKMSKELEENLLQGFERTLDSLCNDERQILKYEKEGDDKFSTTWKKIREFHRGVIINGIRDLIQQVEGKENKSKDALEAFENIKREAGTPYFSTLYDIDMWKEDLQTVEDALKELQIIRKGE